MSTLYLSILKKWWGYDSFRGIQSEIIDSIASGKDTLGLMPTGGGKSITFQVPALAMDGICIVITPLIALMKDQVVHLRQKGIKAESIHAGMGKDDIVRVLDNCIYGNYKFLYVSPERLASPFFQTKLGFMKVSFITIDEAHCISQWGYDFRPSYLEIANIRRLLPGKPVLALTATATPNVIKDIQTQLQFKEENVLKMSFKRSNLSYIVKEEENKYQELLKLLQMNSGQTIIYTNSRERSKEVSEWLNDNGIKSTYYHAGLPYVDRETRQAMWQDENVSTIVCTNAFGMGIDKPNVRLVIHMDIPESLESYFQEAGRAGRDGLPSKSILLYSKNDISRFRRKDTEKFPPKDYLLKLYNDICFYLEIGVGEGSHTTREFNQIEFCRVFHHFPITMLNGLQILSRAGYLHYKDSDDNYSRAMFVLSKADLYQLHHLPKDTEQVINILLRSYGGLFCDYVYIDERDIALRMGKSYDEIYDILKGLSMQRILSYIPRKNTPMITLLQRRIDEREFQLSNEVYEDRLKDYRNRLNHMINYICNKSVCRSNILLRYFGEESKNDCGQCDVCTSKKESSKTHNKQIERAATAIIHILSDSAPHGIDEINVIPFENNIIKEALQWLSDEEEIALVNGQFILL